MSEPISVHVTTREGEQRTVTQGAGHETLMQVLYDVDIAVSYTHLTLPTTRLV